MSDETACMLFQNARSDNTDTVMKNRAEFREIPHGFFAQHAILTLIFN